MKLENNPARTFDLRELSFNGTHLRTIDSTRPGNAISRFKGLADNDRLRSLAVAERVGAIPATKMFFYPLHELDRGGVRQLVLNAFDSLLDRFGSNYTLNVPGIDLSLPPYFGIHQPVVRIIATAFLRKCDPGNEGMGGSQNLYNDIFISDGEGAKDIKQLQQAVSREFREYAKKHVYGDCSTAAQRASFVNLPWAERIEMTSPKDREKAFVVGWMNVWKQRDTPVPDNLTRDLKLEHFASLSPPPESYEESRDPNAVNCVVEFENWFNNRLKELNSEGWKVTHYNLGVKLRVPVPGEPSQMPLNQFYALVQCEREECKANDPDVISGKKKVGDWIYSVEENPDKRPPLKQIRMVADSASITEVVPNLETQQFLAEPLNRLARTADEPLKDWNGGVVTWGYFPNEKVPVPCVRVVHSIMLTEPRPEDGAGESALKNLRFHSRVFRGPHSLIDPSQIKPKIINDLKGLDKNSVQVVQSQEQAEEDLRHFREDREVHEWEWMMEGAIADALSTLRGDLKAIVSGRNYLDQNFPGGVQGFHGQFYFWEDISRPSAHLLEV